MTATIPSASFMDLRSGHAYWPITNGLLHSYPALTDDLTCDVAIIGGGITGALVAHYLVEAGIDTVLLDKRDIASGSTSASTALLQYEVDAPLSELTDRIGKQRAERSYQLCLDSILKLESLVQRLQIDCGFRRKKSLYVASTQRDVADLKREYAARRSMGIDLDWLDRRDIAARFSLGAPAALLSSIAAQVDPYRLAHNLIAHACTRGLRAYDRTTVTAFDPHRSGIHLQTDRGAKIRARQVVMANGYEAQSYLQQKLVTFLNTYAMVSEPVESFEGWGEDQCLIWETAHPYFYARTTDDGRILCGGEDQPYEDDDKRDKRIPKKTDKLLRRLHKWFPAIQAEVAYAWAGVFGETEDGLAYIGQTDEFSRAYFALGYGGNGITYSLIAAELIRDHLCGHKNADLDIFSFDRTAS